VQEAREAARKEDPEGYLEQRRAEMNEYRRAKRALALEPVVRQVERLLAAGMTVGQVAETLEAQGVRAPKP
jgi:hypothetical protein